MNGKIPTPKDIVVKFQNSRDKGNIFLNLLKEEKAGHIQKVSNYHWTSIFHNMKCDLIPCSITWKSSGEALLKYVLSLLVWLSIQGKPEPASECYLRV